MKKIFFISGILMIALLILLITGVMDFRNGIKEAILKGNQLFAAGNYQESLQSYINGIKVKPEDPVLNYNSGQASYCLKDYQQAIEYYNNTEDKVDKYLNSGNSSYKLGESCEDDNQKSQYYLQALQSYQEGIIKFPQNVALKYNYEYVKNKIELQSNNNEDQQNNEENNDNQEENQEENQENGQQANQQSEQDNQQNEQDEEQSGQDGQQDNEQDVQQNGSSLNEANASQPELSDQELDQVLQMLEKMEEDSLKNNQEIVNNDKGEDYDW